MDYGNLIYNLTLNKSLKLEKSHVEQKESKMVYLKKKITQGIMFTAFAKKALVKTFVFILQVFSKRESLKT